MVVGPEIKKILLCQRSGLNLIVSLELVNTASLAGQDVKIRVVAAEDDFVVDENRRAFHRSSCLKAPLLFSA
jgi:hypothetical protein